MSRPVSTVDRARAWAAVDPDPETRAEVEALLSDPAALDERFDGRLAFGTAGMRGPLGAGPRRMNRVLVRQVATALARRVLATGVDHPTVVVGYDARRNSDHFARDTARACAANGVAAVVLPAPAPTPVLAYAVRHLGAAAGVMVTASHNPPADNGYKVYWSDGAQIVPPIDREIATAIDGVGLVDDDGLAPLDHPSITIDDGGVHDAYLAIAAGAVGEGPRDLRAVYTAMHGVGTATIRAGFERAGFPAPIEVVEQCTPDPDFPTVAFPNPEEPGALDLAIATATEAAADVILANDPDADRLAVAIPVDGGWRQLTGNEVGCLLADHLLRRGPRDPDRLVVTTVVSSRLLSRIAAVHGAHYAETLTGFKWIVRPGFEHPTWRLVLGYEEALGYAVSDAVADKDGVTAALVIAEMVAADRAEGRTLVDRLDDLARTHGLHRSAQRSLRFAGADPQEAMGDAMAALRAERPTTVAGRAVERFVDLLDDDTGWPPTDALVMELAGARLVVRPSGTEPKLKIYAESVTPDPGADLRAAETALDHHLDELLGAAPTDLGLEG